MNKYFFLWFVDDRGDFKDELLFLLVFFLWNFFVFLGVVLVGNSFFFLLLFMIVGL